MATKANGKKGKRQVERPPYLDVKKANDFVAKIIEENKEWLKEMANR
jgi:hypothetical protein